MGVCYVTCFEEAAKSKSRCLLYQTDQWLLHQATEQSDAENSRTETPSPSSNFERCSSEASSGGECEPGAPRQARAAIASAPAVPQQVRATIASVPGAPFRTPGVALRQARPAILGALRTTVPALTKDEI